MDERYEASRLYKKKRRMRLMAEHRCIDCKAIDYRTRAGHQCCQRCAIKRSESVKKMMQRKI